MSRKFIILMTGYTCTGKSLLAKKLSKIPNTELFHSAFIRGELKLLPKNQKEAEKLFSYDYEYKHKMDKIIYNKMANYAEITLKKGNNVILDASHLLSWQRKNIYIKISASNVDIFVVKVICKDESVIKKRLQKRSEKFSKSPLHEAPSWNVYIDTKRVMEDPEKDEVSEKTNLYIIEYDSISGEIRFVRGNKNSENSNRIIEAIRLKQ